MFQYVVYSIDCSSKYWWECILCALCILNLYSKYISSKFWLILLFISYLSYFFFLSPPEKERLKFSNYMCEYFHFSPKLLSSFSFMYVKILRCLHIWIVILYRYSSPVNNTPLLLWNNSVYLVISSGLKYTLFDIYLANSAFLGVIYFSIFFLACAFISKVYLFYRACN